VAAESTSVCSKTPVVRATSLAGGLGWFLGSVGSQAHQEETGDNEVLEFSPSGPLHRCVHADLESFDEWGSCSCEHGSGAFWFWLPLLTAEVDNHVGTGLAKVVLVGFWYSIGVPGSRLVAEVSKRRQAQRSHPGCGLVGGRGPSSCGTPDVYESHCERNGVGSLTCRSRWVTRRRVRGGLLAGGRCLGLWKPRTFTGEGGSCLGWSFSRSGVGTDWRQGHQSRSARTVRLVKSSFTVTRQLGEAGWSA
jgi:hypothetical protein